MNLEQLQNEAIERLMPILGMCLLDDKNKVSVLNETPGILKNFLKQEIKNAIQTAQQETIKMLENTDVQMSVNGDVSQDEIAMAKFIYKRTKPRKRNQKKNKRTWVLSFPW